MPIGPFEAIKQARQGQATDPIASLTAGLKSGLAISQSINTARLASAKAQLAESAQSETILKNLDNIDKAGRSLIAAPNSKLYNIRKQVFQKSLTGLGLTVDEDLLKELEDPEERKKFAAEFNARAEQIASGDLSEIKEQISTLREVLSEKTVDGLLEKSIAQREAVSGAKAILDNTTKLRKERSNLPITKDTQTLATAIEKVRGGAKNPSAAGDVAMIFNFMKMLDPGSVVREGEFATAQNAGGVADRVKNLYNRLLSGKRLTNKQRKDFLTQAEGAWASQLKVQEKADRFFAKEAKTQNLDPSRVLIPFGQKEIDSQTQDIQLNRTVKPPAQVKEEARQEAVRPTRQFRKLPDELKATIKSAFDSGESLETISNFLGERNIKFKKQDLIDIGVPANKLEGL